MCNSYGNQTLAYNLFDSQNSPLMDEKKLNFVCHPDIQTKWKVDQDSGNVYLVVNNKSSLATPINFAINDSANNETWQTELASGQEAEHIFSSLNCNNTAQSSQKYLINLNMLLTGNANAYHQQQAIFYPNSSCGNGLLNAGFNHSMFASSKGQLWSWGYNHNGQLGNNWYIHDYIVSSYPIKVAMDNMAVGSISDMATGNQHNIALDEKTNILWAWGDNTYGQLGNNESNNFEVTPVKVDMTNIGNAKITSVSAGYYHSLALDENGKIWAWGGNFHGELGDNSIDNHSKPVAVDISNITATNAKVVAIATGFYHSLALDNNGKVWVWGYNNLGQLGMMGVSYVTKPTLFNTNSLTQTGAKVIAITAGNFHNLILDNKGKLWGWGYNKFGQLGNNSTTNSTSIVAINQTNIPATAKIKKVIAGGHHNLILLHTGEIYGWGDNSSGALGTGNTTNASVPTLLNPSVFGTVKVLNITTAGTHSLALDNYGQVWSWGNNQYGQLGNHSNTSSNTPVKVNMSEIDKDNQTN